MRKWFAYVLIIFMKLTVSQTNSVESISKERYWESRAVDPVIPTNRNSSIQYLLYTSENPVIPCYIEPVASIFDVCTINQSHETKFVIHGFQTKLSHGNLLEKIKDKLLEFDKYNVIVVNWTKYNQQNYIEAVFNAYVVGIDVADMIHFITKHTGVSATSFHLIGHSLGAHISGVAGKHVYNLGRITGLDPAGPLYDVKVKFDRLTSKDALLVDAIHTSNEFGESYPLARINFYPNGGITQPMCQYGKNFTGSDGEEYEVRTSTDQAICNHDSSLTYFISSILDCKYFSTQCENCTALKSGICSHQLNQMNKMGFHCVKTIGLQRHSKFYLNTSGTSPFC